jgi:hypothetical protein
MALNYLRGGVTTKADAYWQRWLSLEHLVEHAFVHEMAEKYKEERASGKQDFNVPWQGWQVTENKLKTYNYHHRRLKRWLFERAKDDAKTAPAIATKLGINKASVYRWAKDLKLKIPKDS